MIDYLQNLVFTANIVAPIFLIVFLGILFRKSGLINPDFVTVSSKIVFSVTLPALIFMKVAGMDLEEAINWKQIAYIYSGIILTFLFLELFAILFIGKATDQGVFVLGVFRSNFAIVGLAIVANMFGESGLARAAMLLAFIVPLYNVLSVIALTLPFRKIKGLNWRQILVEILKNPLILAVVLALPFAYFRISIHPVLMKTGDYLASLTLPLALLGIGGSLDFASLKVSSTLAVTAMLSKLVVVPVILTLGAIPLGFLRQEIAIMFVLFACPSAVAGFIMVKAMGGNETLASNIILLTTLGSVVTISSGIFILRAIGLL